MTVFRPLDWQTGAQRALIESGACRACPNHSDIFLRSDDPSAERHAYAIATNMLKFGKVREGSQQDFMSCVAEAITNLEDRCYICDAANQVD
jgi:hypothetical protein